MIFPSIYLFLMTVTGTGDYREHYIGKVRDCEVADEIMHETKTIMKRQVLGYICLNFEASSVRKGFKNSRIIQEFDIELVAQYTLTPILKKKKLKKRRSKDGDTNNRVSN